MNTKSLGKEGPIVTKTPKKNWRIPRLDEMARRRELEREEALLKQFGEGTTPQGRELLRKLMYNCERQLRDGKTISAVVADIEPEVRQFAMLREEWSLLLSRIAPIRYSHLIEARPYFFAGILVTIVQIRIARDRSKNEAALTR